MSGVNTSGLLLRDAIGLCERVIEMLASSQKGILQKYRVAGNGWTDSKYHQLGDIVNDCNYSTTKAISEFEVCLSSLSRLEKAIAAYDEINLTGSILYDGDMPGNDLSVVRTNSGSTDSTLSNATPVSCCGVRVNSGAIDLNYLNHLEARYSIANPIVRNVYDKYASVVVIQSVNSNETAHYLPSSRLDYPRGIYYNAESDNTNPRGRGVTFYHEVGHMIDNAATDFNGYISNNREFGDALRQDGQNVLEAYNSLTPERRQSFTDRIRQDSSHSLSDLLDATTGGVVRGRYGHDRDYWSGDGNLEAEAFAHFFEAEMGDADKRALLARFFPNAYNVFSRVIQSLNT